MSWTATKSWAMSLGAIAVAAMTAVGLAAASAAEPRFAALPGKAVGVLVPDGGDVLEREGRSGPMDGMVFSRDGASYRWLLLPAVQGEIGEPAAVEIGTTTGPRVFKNVLLATRAVILARGLPGGFSLVEAEVNAGLGSPAADRFVATSLRRLDGSREMPVILEQVVDAVLTKCRDEWPASEAEAKFDQLRRSAIGDEVRAIKEQRTVPYVTWLSNERKVQVTCTVSLVGREQKSGIGIVPDRPHDGQQTPYGKSFGVRRTARFLVLPSGQILSGPAANLETFLFELPPPGGPGPPRSGR